MNQIQRFDHHLYFPSQTSAGKALEDKLLIVDVRSSKEFQAGTFPGAVNIPILDNEERAIVGTIYKQEGKKEAVVHSYEIVSKKMDALREAFLSLGQKNLVVMCARGGFRSRAGCSFLEDLGISASQLEGGYKSFRKYTIHFFETLCFQAGLIVLHGPTGSGKTLLLGKLKNVIDLENCAQHRGSLFGGIGLQPVSQKEFEGRLLFDLYHLDYSQPIFVEGESKKIGRIVIPKQLFATMQTTPLKVWIDCPIECRVRRTVEEYLDRNNLQSQGKEEINQAICSLETYAGKEKIRKWKTLLEKDQFEDLVKSLYLEHYDSRYEHKAKNKQFAKTVCGEDIEECARLLENWRSIIKT